MVRGGAVYHPDGRLVGTFSETPRLTLEAIDGGAPNKMRRKNSDRYEVLWRAGDTAMPVTVIARLDSSQIGSELAAFIWRIAGLVLLISISVCGATMAVLGRSVLWPIIKLRRSLSAAGEDPANAERHALSLDRDDELGDVAASFNHMLRLVSRNIMTIQEREAKNLPATSRRRLRPSWVGIAPAS